MKNEVVIHSENDLQSRIYTIRGLPVMLDFDLAEIYGYEVKRLNQQVKRNISRFPDDFMFQLTKKEYENLISQIVISSENCDLVMSQNATSREPAILKSQIVTSSENNDLVKSQFVTSPKKEILMSQNATSSWGGTRKLPYAFTEQGIYMLATVLRGELAEQQSIFIMRAFRELKHYVQENLQFVTRNEMQLLSNSVLTIAEKQKKNDSEIKKICENIDKINENFVRHADFKNFVIYKGQKFEADVAYTDIYSLAEKSIFVIDDYVDIKTLDLLKHKKSGVQVILFTQNGYGRKGYLTASVVNDFNSQYPTLSIKPNPDCHDRFIIIDYKTVTEKAFHCGASSKDAGRKVCAINRFENATMVYPVVDKLLSQKDLILN